MKFARVSLLVIGIFAMVIGLVWMGQGSGYFPYPPSSFMIDESVWITRGFILAAAGAVIAVVSRYI